MNYVEVTIEFSELHPWRDIVLSELSNRNFESFVETKSGLKAYIPEKDFKETELNFIHDISAVSDQNHLLIPDQNWNAKWEENFPPVFVEEKLVIKAPFHQQKFEAPYVITVQPQMSFGTGHHQTTWLMAQRMFEINLIDKDVLDMGTGTGVLAILAEKLGAKSVLAPDIDEWSYRNAKDNVALNDCHKIEVLLGDHQLLYGKKFDLIIANINKNVLIHHFSVYSECLKPGGKLLISGFFTTDQDDLKTIAEELGFIFEQLITKDEWALMQFRC
ncbi:MAG: 50S ribosomal protein L11 methyltransferase [Crocinitomicaceae bacterium]